MLKNSQIYEDHMPVQFQVVAVEPMPGFECPKCGHCSVVRERLWDPCYELLANWTNMPDKPYRMRCLREDCDFIQVLGVFR
jgi:hypothetical protein